MGVELSQRQAEVLQLAARGRTNGGIASELGLSADTVKTHIARILARLDASNRAHAVAIGIKLGIISAD